MSRISWKQINKAVEAIEAGGTEDGVFRSAVEQLALLVPFAHGAATPNMNLKEIRQRVSFRLARKSGLGPASEELLPKFPNS